MAEQTSPADHATPPSPHRGHRTARTTAAAVYPAQDAAPRVQSRMPSRPRTESSYSDTPADRYAFYFFMATTGAGVLAMVIMALAM